jgi:predicted ArsR family transcriptional regulator
METATSLKNSTRRVAELLSSQRANVDAIADVLGVHKRTVYRALNEIQDHDDYEVVRRGESGNYTYAVEHVDAQDV